MYPHRIRLRGPWECEPLAPPSPPTPLAVGQASQSDRQAGKPDLPAEGNRRRVTMPCRWADAGLAGYRGLARFTRKFGYPGKADRDIEPIWLPCAGCPGERKS